MSGLTPDEARVLGVLVEKAQTTPTQYPMTLNAVVNGCNQKNNRHPVSTLGEDQVLAALDGLRAKQMVREVMLSGSRVPKYRHTAREGLEVGTSELVVLAELMLRGPQTIGELRGRASRMHPLESMEIVSSVLDHLMSRTPPLVKRLAPAPGSRAERYAQQLCPGLHPEETPTTTTATSAAASESPVSGAARDVHERLDRLEQEVAALRRQVASLQAGVAPAPMRADD